MVELNKIRRIPMYLRSKNYKEILDIVQEHAEEASGCLKVSVGAALVDRNDTIFVEANYGPCKERGVCNRIKLYGEDSKSHRLPSDCLSVHSEIAVIGAAAGSAWCPTTTDSTIIVTRYPCEACARAIVAARIKTVIYGRKQEISDLTKEIFDEAGVEVIWVSDWDADDTTR